MYLLQLPGRSHTNLINYRCTISRFQRPERLPTSTHTTHLIRAHQFFNFEGHKTTTIENARAQLPTVPVIIYATYDMYYSPFLSNIVMRLIDIYDININMKKRNALGDN